MAAPQQQLAHVSSAQLSQMLNAVKADIHERRAQLDFHETSKNAWKKQTMALQLASMKELAQVANGGMGDSQTMLVQQEMIMKQSQAAQMEINLKHLTSFSKVVEIQQELQVLQEKKHKLVLHLMMASAYEGTHGIVVEGGDAVAGA